MNMKEVYVGIYPDGRFVSFQKGCSTSSIADAVLFTEQVETKDYEYVSLYDLFKNMGVIAYGDAFNGISLEGLYHYDDACEIVGFYGNGEAVKVSLP
jgi:hypothetical protein